MQSDSILVEKTLAGDSSAYEKLILKYQDMVYGLAFHFVKNFAEAQDLAQEALMKAYLNLAALRDKDRFASWLKRITVNVCKSWLFQQKAYRLLFNPIESDDVRTEVLQIADRNPTPDEAFERSELRSIVMRAIEALSEKNRLVVTLFYLNGQSYKEVADFLDISEVAVQSRLQRAREQLKKEILQMVGEAFGERKLNSKFAEDTMRRDKMYQIASWYIDDKIYVNETAYNFFRCPVCAETFLWQATKEEPRFCPTCVSFESYRKRFVFWAELEKSGFNKFDELFSEFTKDELFMLYEGGTSWGYDVKDPIREKLIDIYTQEALEHHRKEIKWPLKATQHTEVDNKLYNKAHRLGAI